MTQVKHDTGKAQATQEYNQFKTATTTLKTVWGGFSGADKQTALTTLSSGWGVATAAQKAEALRVAVCLLYIIVAYLAHRELNE